MVEQAYSGRPDDLKRRVDLRQIVAHFWGRPEQERGGYAVYASRWRDDGRRPAFTVYDAHFKDYGGTGISGDVFDFIMQEMNIDFRSAVAWVTEYLGGSIEAGIPRSAQSQPTAHGEPPSAQWQAAARKAIQQTQAILWQTPAALDYLRRDRGLNDDTIRRAGYGYNTGWLPIDWINPATGHPVFLPPGIIEPWITEDVVWAVRIRCRVGNLADALDIPQDTLRNGDPMPKYLNLAGSKQGGALYNADAITPGCDLLIVEGGFDARLAEQILGDRAAVVTFGSATNYPGSRRLKQIQRAGRIFLLLDADDAGQHAQSRLAEALGGDALTVTLPPGHDVTDFVQSGGQLPALLAAASVQSWWSGGLPDNIRTALLNYFRPVTAPLIELVNAAVQRGLLNPNQFTLDELLIANITLDFNVSESSLRRVVSELEGYFFSQLETKVASNGQRGRMKLCFRLLPLEKVKASIIAWAAPRIYEKHHPAEPQTGQGIIARPTGAMLESLGFEPAEAEKVALSLDAAFNQFYEQQEQAQIKANHHAFRVLARLTRDLENPHSTPLPENWPLSSGTQYRAAFLRATNDPDERRSRRDIQQLLGVANGSVDAMIARAGLAKADPTGAYEFAEITRRTNIDKQIRHTAGKLHGYPLSIISHNGSGQSHEQAFRGAESLPFIAQTLATGGTVHIRYQVANRYVACAEESPEMLPTPVTRASRDEPGERSIQILPRRSCFGPNYNPEWLSDQWALALIQANRLRYRPSLTLYDTLTGEILSADGQRPDPRILLSLLWDVLFP